MYNKQEYELTIYNIFLTCAYLLVITAFMYNSKSSRCATTYFLKYIGVSVDIKLFDFRQKNFKFLGYIIHLLILIVSEY